jgi:hypothetical protein
MPKNPYSQSSQNATKHGMCQERFLLLPWESKKDFDALRETYLAQYDLNEPAVAPLVETLTERDWLQQRCALRICKLEAELAEAECSGNDERIDKLEKRLLHAQRCKTAAENSFKRAFQLLEQFRRTRVREEQQEQRLEILEFGALERALVARIRNDIGVEQQMKMIKDEPEPDDADRQSAETEPEA